MPGNPAETQTWDPNRYALNARYVATFADPMIPWLAPRRGERILDLGCGDGYVTERLIATGATVVGVDASAAMVAAAKARGIDARAISVYDLEFNREFDAVFSNSVLHWVLEPERAAARIFRALKPGGRFVAEFGGHGCCAASMVATAAVLDRRGIQFALVNPWYYPSAEEYRAVLEGAGFIVDRMELAPLPVRLGTGMAGFIDTFCENFFRPLTEYDRRAAQEEVIALLRNSMCDRSGVWTMDFVRVRLAARVPA